MNNATAAEKGSKILWLPGPLPKTLEIDEPTIRHVLNNLLANAIKFSPPSSTITVKSEVDEKYCSIVVQDEGPGIPPSERDKLFKIFGRTSVRPTGGESTIGLGLSICYKIMQAHAGTIRVDDAPGGGAEFRITFPLHA